MPPDTIQPIQDILNRWILIGQALVGSIGALAFVVAFFWTKIGRFKARTNAPTINADNGPEVRPRDQAPLIGRTQNRVWLSCRNRATSSEGVSGMPADGIMRHGPSRS